MKITYEFVTGEVSEVEVDERLGGMLLDLDRQQENNDQKETRRHFSLDGMGLTVRYGTAASAREVCTMKEGF